MDQDKNVAGHVYRPFHAGWGGFAEELFHYTSRYYVTTEAFLRNLSGNRGFAMSGYRAQWLSPPQRDLMAVLLAARPERDIADGVISVVSAVIARDSEVASALRERYRTQLEQLSERSTPHQLDHGAPRKPPEVAPLDPFLNIAERLQMPVAVHERHVEISLHALAAYLDSPNSTLRANLQNAILQLHDAGFMLCNHPHLTHAEAQQISDDSPD